MSTGGNRSMFLSPSQTRFRVRIKNRNNKPLRAQAPLTRAGEREAGRPAPCALCDPRRHWLVSGSSPHSVLWDSQDSLRPGPPAVGAIRAVHILRLPSTWRAPTPVPWRCWWCVRAHVCETHSGPRVGEGCHIRPGPPARGPPRTLLPPAWGQRIGGWWLTASLGPWGGCCAC